VPSVVALLSLLVCILIGGVAYVGWQKGGPDTKKLLAGDSPNGGDLAEVEIAPGVKMTFCWVPPGNATLGSPASETGHDESEPEYEYTSRGFWLAKYPVTQEEWRALMKANPSPSTFTPAQKDVQKAGIANPDRFPVENVSWNDCQDFLKAMNAEAKVPAMMGKGKFVLPHEDEWEYACRGDMGNKRAFYFGGRLNGDLANCDGTNPYGTETKGEYKKRTTRVGDYEKVAPHPWGLCDMHGNVWQWCEDLRVKFKDSRILRGGSWSSGAAACRSANRNWSDLGRRNPNYGFRPCFRLD
jgi:formylglycine-generating enzyme required for sulfatase activity